MDEVAALIKVLDMDVRSADAMAESNSSKKKVTSVRNRITRCEKRAMNEVDPEKKSKLISDLEKLMLEEIEACNEMVTHARDTELGDYFQILGGLKEFQEVLKGFDSAESKRAQSSLEYASENMQGN